MSGYLLDDRSIHRRGTEHPDPGGDFKTRNRALRDGGNLRRQFDTLRRRHRERDHLARLDVRRGRSQVDGSDLDLTSEQIGHDRRAATIGHVHEIGAGGLLQQLDRQMLRRIGSGRSKGDPARSLFGLCDHFRQRTKSRLGVSHENERDVDQLCDRRQLLQRFEIDALLGNMRVDDQRACRADAQRMPIRRRARQSNEARGAAGSGPVLHHDGLAEGLTELLTDGARDPVRRRAGSKRNDDGKIARGNPWA